MNEVISKSDARKLMGRVFSKAGPTQHKFRSALLKHSEATYKIAKETSMDLINQNPALEINPCETAIAGYLHDIGRPLNVNQNFHEIRGAEYIRNKGLREGIAVDEKRVERLSGMIISHFIVYEMFQDKTYGGWEEFPGIKASTLLPTDIEQQIIVYSDLSNLEGEVMDFRERLSYIRKNRIQDKRFMHAFNKGEPRISKICEGIEGLRRGLK